MVTCFILNKKEIIYWLNVVVVLTTKIGVVRKRELFTVQVPAVSVTKCDKCYLCHLVISHYVVRTLSFDLGLFLFNQVAEFGI